MAPLDEEAVFHLARKIASPEARDEYLREACGANAALQARVQALLAVHDNEQGFLVSPVSTVAIQARMDEGIGTIVGTYRLLEPLGEGGFGVVFLAEQFQPIHRNVALKVLKPGMDTRQVVARFQAERQALALMDHPNIAQVFDAGETPSGRPYFVMELVRGVPVTDFCDQNHLPVRDRLGLFVSVCRAVQHAHQKGVIHRDLKPSNVMVTQHDGAPVVKVIDFGIAKATGRQLTDKTLFTSLAQMIGTPLYMSPEQAEMSGQDVDTRSDIYSLGVLLYELLTGTTPFDQDRLRAAAYDEIRRIIREEEPARPSMRLSTLGAAAVTVSANRGSDPKRLSQMFHGELDWVVMKCLEKDRTRRYETADGLVRDIERYLHDEPVHACPPSVGYRVRKFVRRHTAGVATAALTLFFVVLLGGGIGWVVRDRIARQTRNAAAVRAALDEARQYQTAGKWALGQAAAERAEALLASGEGSEELRQSVHDLLVDLRMVARLEEVRIVRSGLRNGFFDSAAADAGYAAAFRDYGIDIESLNPEEAKQQIAARGIRIELATALDGWAETRRLVSQKGRKSWRDLLTLARRVDPDASRMALRGAVLRGDRQSLVRRAASEDARSLPPAILVLLAECLVKMGSLTEATDLLRRAREGHSGDFWINHTLALYLTDRRNPRWDDAIPFHTAAVALRPESPGARLNLGVALWQSGRLDEAAVANRFIIAQKPDYAEAHCNLGGILREMGKHDEGLAAVRRALELKPDLPQAHFNLGLALAGQGRVKEAAAAYQRVVELRRDNYPEAYNNLGLALHEMGQLEPALAAYRRAIELKPELFQAHFNLGRVMQDLGRADDAAAAYRRTIELKPTYAEAHCNLGVTLDRLGRFDEALAAYRRATELKPDLRQAHFNLGSALEQKGQLDEAIAAYRRVIELKSDDPVPHYDLGNALEAKGELAESAIAYRRAIELKPDYAEAHCNLGCVLRQQGKFAEALAALERGHEFGSRRADWPYASAQWVEEHRRLGELAGRLPAVLRGEFQPADTAERHGYALLCYDQKRYVATARLRAEALTADPKLSDDLVGDHRFIAAGAAVLAASGRGVDANEIDDRERVRWREQALAWLRADLSAYRKLLSSDKLTDRQLVRHRLRHWQGDRFLADVRDPSAVAKLPAGEQDAWKQLWAEVQTLLSKADAAR